MWGLFYYPLSQLAPVFQFIKCSFLIFMSPRQITNSFFMIFAFMLFPVTLNSLCLIDQLLSMFILLVFLFFLFLIRCLISLFLGITINQWLQQLKIAYHIQIHCLFFVSMIYFLFIQIQFQLIVFVLYIITLKQYQFKQCKLIQNKKSVFHQFQTMGILIKLEDLSKSQFRWQIIIKINQSDHLKKLNHSLNLKKGFIQSDVKKEFGKPNNIINQRIAKAARADSRKNAKIRYIKRKLKSMLPSKTYKRVIKQDDGYKQSF